MNRIQWFVLGIGLLIFGNFLAGFPGICTGDGDLLVACFVRRYALVVPGLISGALGVIFVILGFLEYKKK